MAANPAQVPPRTPDKEVSGYSEDWRRTMTAPGTSPSEWTSNGYRGRVPALM